MKPEITSPSSYYNHLSVSYKFNARRYNIYFFFAVGCIVFTIFSTIFIWWCLTTYNSFINTKEINRLLNHNSRYISMEKLLPIKENNININVIASGSTSLGNLSPKKL